MVVVKRFWNLAWEAGLTGLASMVAYNMLLAVVPVALGVLATNPRRVVVRDAHSHEVQALVIDGTAGTRSPRRVPRW